MCSGEIVLNASLPQGATSPQTHKATPNRNWHMKAFTILDVVRYEKCRSDPNITLGELLKYFIIKIMNRSEQDCIRKQLQSFPEWIYLSYQPTNKTIHRDMISLDIKIVKGEWQQHECEWIINIVNIMLVKTKSLPWLCGGFEHKVLSHPNELFYTFCEIIRLKFPNDEYLNCIMNDLIKSMTIN